MVDHNRTIRQDVRELGELLGTIIREQTSESTFETVESIRQAAIAYRRGTNGSREAFEREVANLAPELERDVARAFTTYFELINLAEERERVRVIRRESDEGTLRDTISDAVGELREDPDTAEDVFDDVFVEPTFTAHPTEARRKTVNAKLRTIAGYIEELDERELTDRERNRIWEHIESEVTSLWQTPQLRHGRPSPEDEARNVQWYLSNTIFDVVGDIYDELERASSREGLDIEIPTLFEFRSWAGSDRDGNPFVTPEVTSWTLDEQRRMAIGRYRRELDALGGLLSQDVERVGSEGPLERSIEADRRRLPSVTAEQLGVEPDEPYRTKLAYMRERLDRIDDVRPGGYQEAQELVEDLEVIAEELRRHGGENLIETDVDPIRRRVETFAFTLASHDIRDHRENHTIAVDELLGRAGVDYRTLDESERQRILTEAILQDDRVIDLEADTTFSDTTLRVLNRFTSLADWQMEYGSQVIDTYCISMTEEVSHVLEVAFLADQVDVISIPDHSGIDVVPLLETEYALGRARDIMGTLFENEAYGQIVAARGDLQEVMIGYSDSNKENGFLAANWSLYSNQRTLAEITDEYDLTLRLFHGRGGSISRGGGPMNRALLALPRDTISGQVKFTVQGEAIAESYANPRIADRELEQMLNAQLRIRRQAIEHDHRDVPDDWTAAMETMAGAARRAYRDLLTTDGFVDYFEQTTPIGVIDELHLGSRPTSRTGKRRPEDLRAIPWVFSWTQARCILPGWYALGTGIEAFLEEGSMKTLRAMYENWPFFATTLDNAAMALAKTEMDVAAVYADLADPGLHEEFFPPIREEYDRAVTHVKAITGRDTLVDRPWLEESLELRNPYVDPLNELQASLLGRSNRSEIEDRTLRLTVKGIAAGMKNTG